MQTTGVTEILYKFPFESFLALKIRTKQLFLNFVILSFIIQNAYVHNETPDYGIQIKMCT